MHNNITNKTIFLLPSNLNVKQPLTEHDYWYNLNKYTEYRLEVLEYQETLSIQRHADHADY